MSIPILNLPNIQLPSEMLARNAQIAQSEANTDYTRQQTSALEQDQILKAQKMQQQAALEQLTQEATKNPQALQALANVSPERASQIQEFQNNQVIRLGKTAQAFKMTERANKPQVYQQTLQTLSQQGFDISDMPAEYDPKLVDAKVDFAINSARDIEKQIGSRQIVETGQGLLTVNPQTGQADQVQLGNQGVTPYVKPPSTVVNVGGEEPAFRKKFEESRGTKLAERLDKIETDADSATGLLGQLDSIEANLKEVGNTGPLDSARIFMSNLGTQLGLDIDLSETSSLEQINAASKQITVPLVKQLGVNPTDRDAKIIEATAAGLGKSKDANMRLIDVMRQVANKKIIHAQIADRLRRQGKEEDIPSAIREYDLKVPLKPLASAVEPPKSKDGMIDITKLRKGKLYIRGNEIYEYDGVGFVKK